MLAQLRLIVGDSDVSLEAHDLQAHGEDRYSYHGGTKRVQGCAVRQGVRAG